MQLVTSTELETLKSEGKKLLIDFYADWCGPCKMLGPKLEMLESQYPNVKFVKLDVDKEKEYAKNLQIFSIPTVFIFNGSVVTERIPGVRPDSHYKDILSKL